ncbi:VWA domain-containing protein [Luteitalea sp. TBR-22]|uniref:VWA domain-containing protein n=1 Tax=Luteitalea sp. TBR-22 TaxID=2802971 RepID=UPI001EF5530A
MTVDVVVRDSRGRPVLDLARQDFEVRENGALQSVLSFEAPAVGQGASFPEAGVNSAAVSTTASASQLIGPNTGAINRRALPTAIVFDRLAPQPRQLAYAASLAHIEALGADLPPTGIFVLDPRLQVAQDFTGQKPSLVRALDSVRRRANWEYSFRVASSEDDAERALRQAAGLPAPAGANDATQFLQLERVQAGYAALGGLRLLVKAMADPPGRKSVVLFSEGLLLTRDLEGDFERLIAEANRANVSFYIINSAGLTTVSDEYRASQQIQSAAKTMLDCDPSVSVCSAISGLDRGEGPDTNARSFDQTAGLSRLAQDTGGTFVRNRNDFDVVLRRMQDDRRHHYLLTYASTNPTLDGTFRPLKVQVRRRGTSVSARRGFVASRVESSKPWLSRGDPAVLALEASPLPNAFPSMLDVVRVPSNDGGRAAIVVDVPIEHLTASAGAPTPSRVAVVVARVRALNGDVIQTFAQRYVLDGALSLRNGQQPRLRFLCAAVLSPGPYTVESAVHDEAGRRSSVRVKSLDMPAVSKFSAGDVFLASRVVPIKSGDVAEGHPFLTRSGHLVEPLAGTRVSRAQQPELIVAVPLDGQATPGQLTISLSRAGDAPLQAAMPVDAGAGPGTQVFRIPTGSLQDGSYTLQVSGDSQGNRWLRELRLTVAP